jgi:hypothetical protein
VEENYKPFYQEEGIVIIQAIIDTSSRRHSVFESRQSMEEDVALLRRNDTLLFDGMRSTRSSSMRFTEEPLVPPRHST